MHAEHACNKSGARRFWRLHADHADDILRARGRSSRELTYSADWLSTAILTNFSSKEH